MAVDLMEMLKGAVSQQILGKIGGTVGMDEKKTSSVFDLISGVILGKLMKKASTPQGAETVYKEAKDQDAGILDKLDDLLGGGEQTEELRKKGGGLLETILGGDQSNLLETLAKAIGLDKDMIGKLIKMVAPIVMAVVGRHLKAKALDAVGLGKVLGEQKQYLGNYVPASLAGDLGFGDMLGDAGKAISGAAGSVSAVGRSASGAAKQATTDAANQGAGLMKMLIPLLVIGLIAFGVWKFVFNQPAVDADNQQNVGQVEQPAGTTGFDFGNLNLSALGEKGKTLTNGFSEITAGLKGLQDQSGDESGANQLVEKISGFSGQIDGMDLGGLKGVAKTTMSGMIDKFVEKIKGLMEQVPAPLKAIVEPAIDGLLAKLKTSLS